MGVHIDCLVVSAFTEMREAVGESAGNGPAIEQGVFIRSKREDPAKERRDLQILSPFCDGSVSIQVIGKCLGEELLVHTSVR
jgi:hypothetical protein